MARVAAQLEVQYGSSGVEKTASDARMLGGVIDDVGKKGGWLGTAIGTGVGIIGAGAISKGIDLIGRFGGGILGANAQAETLGMALETAVGDRAKDVYADLQKFAKDTPFEFPELVASTINLENFGITADKTIQGVGRNWREVIGDTAAALAGQGVTIDQVTQAVTDAQFGQYERLTELGIKATTEGEKVKFSWIENNKQMTAEVDKHNTEMVQSTLAAIWNGKYEGAMETQAQSFNGQWSTLSDNWNMRLQKMSAGVFDFAKKGLKTANSFFDEWSKGEEEGLSTFDAGMKALDMTLEDVLGPTAGNMAFAGIERLVSGFETGARVGGRFASTVFNLGGALGMAFFEHDRDKFIERLPGFLQGTGRNLSTIAEAAGDLWRSFDRGGFDAMWGTLLNGGEGEQIINALGRIGSDAWDALSGAIVAGASAGIDLGVWTVTSGIPLLGGFLLDVGGDLWGWAKGKMGIGPAATVGDGTGGPESDSNRVTLGDWTLDTAIPTVTGFVTDTAGDLWGWVKGKMGLGTTPVGDGTGGPEFDNRVDLGDWFLDTAIPTVTGWVAEVAGDVWGGITSAAGWAKDDAIPATLAFTAEWGGVAWGKGGEFVAWFRSNVPGLAADGVTASVKLLSGWGGNVWGTYGDDFQGWFRSGVGALKATVEASIDVVASTNDAGEDDEIYQSGHDTGQNIIERLQSGLTDGASAAWDVFAGIGGGGGGEGGGGESTWQKIIAPTKIDQWATGFVTGVVGQLATNFASNMDPRNLDIPNPFSGIGDLIGGWWDDATSGTIEGAMEGSPGQQRDRTPSGGMFAGMFEDISNGWDDFKSDIGLLDWSLPSIPFDTSAVTDSVDAVIDFIEDRIDDLKAAWAWLQFWKDADPSAPASDTQDPLGGSPGQQRDRFPNNFPGYVDPNGKGPEGAPDAGQGIASWVVPIDADTTQAEAKINDLKGLFGGGSAGGRKAGPADVFTVTVEVEVDREKAAADLMAMIESRKDAFKAKLTFDNTDAAKAILVTSNWGNTFADQIFTGKLDFDTSAAAQGYTDAFGWGDVFSAQTFIADLDFNTTPAAQGYTAAFGWGSVFANQVFTATLNFDTSPVWRAVDDVRNAMQQISDMLPHSPAKKGPLARPISWAYLADELASTMGLMGPLAERGMAGVASALSGTSGTMPRLSARATAPAQTVVIQNIYQVTPPELAELMRNAEAGGRVGRDLARELNARRSRSTV